MDLNTHKIEISYKTILFAIGVVIGIWFLFTIREIVFLLFLSVIAASGLRPSVDRLVELKIPRVFAILITYLVVFSFGFLMIAYLVPSVSRQSTKLIDELGYFFQFLSPYVQITPENFQDKIAPYGANIYRATVEIFSGVINIFSFFIFTFYLLLERRHLRLFLRKLLGEVLKDRVVKTALKVESKLGAWVQGELSLMLLIGIMTFVVLTLLGVEFALPLAIIAGFLEIVPIIGPIVSAIPAVIIALIHSPLLALGVGLSYFLIQQLENHVLVPMVMRKAVGVPPMVSILAILIGGKLAGAIGALIAIPIFVCLQILLDEFIFNENNKKGGSS